VIVWSIEILAGDVSEEFGIGQGMAGRNEKKERQEISSSRHGHRHPKRHM